MGSSALTRKWQLQQLSAKLCQRCGKPLDTDGTRCLLCSRKNASNTKIKRWVRR